MATPKPAPFPAEDERLPLLIGFQRVAENTARQTRFIDHGRGIYVYDTDGREYIEATASFYVAALGYQNEELIDAIARQYRELPFFVSALNRTSRVSLELAEKLVALAPVKDAHILFGATGSEANDFLIKLLRFGAVARGEPARATIIGRHGSYHGGTLATASLTGGHHEEFGLPLAGFRHVAQPDYHGERRPGESGADYSARLAAELEALIAAEPPASIAAMFCEPISFSAGFKPPPAEYFPAITAVLDAHGIELVADEVITGCGRTGRWWGSETMALRPAHATMAKGVTSGYFPLSAIAIGADLYGALEAGSERFGTLAHAATYAAHPVGAAAALKTLEIIERDGLVEHAARLGERLGNGLRAFADHPLVGDVRALGLAASLDFLRRDGDDRPANDDADAVLERVYGALLERGVVGRPAGRSLVIAPPLIVQADEIDEICRRIGLALDDALAA
ncbi:MAG: aminotransferase class III-fold pyridoxal phosphate-dependent enzyme [Gammaproteobacteria bacterium]|nr:aminotransferase class III-fold pyridoxal phosphate-dependent enzyme [Gammaproteobacteria bacterium]